MNQFTNIEVLRMPFVKVKEQQNINNGLKTQELQLKNRLANMENNINTSIMFEKSNHSSFTNVLTDMQYNSKDSDIEGFENRTTVDRQYEARFTDISNTIGTIESNIKNITNSIVNGAIPETSVSLYYTILSDLQDVSQKVSMLDKERKMLLDEREEGIKKISELLRRIADINDNVHELKKRFTLSAIRVSDTTELYKNTYSTYILIGMASVITLYYVLKNVMSS